MRYLITSLPPRISRMGPEGEIGEAYQARCAASWKSAGFVPVSVNSHREIDADFSARADGLGIRVVGVDRDAAAITGRPNVFLADILRIGCELAGDDRFAITNADIIVEPSPALRPSLNGSLPPETLLFARRIDVARPGERSGEPYRHGFDFFGVHPGSVRALPDFGLIFGAPWWDHYFPLMLALRGCLAIQSREPMAFHLAHEERWDPALFVALGQRYLEKALSVAATPTPVCGLYSQLLANAVARKTASPTADWVYAARRRLLPWDRAKEPRRLLRRVANANVTFLDKLSPHHVSP